LPRQIWHIIARRLYIFVRAFFMRLGEFLKSLTVVVMRPDDLIELSHQTYAQPQRVAGWSERDLVNPGLRPGEMLLLKQVPQTGDRLLLLGVGGGREAIPLARMDFTVTGVDFIPAMVEQVKTNAARCGVNIKGLV
jgi:2-polyprenyl-3-methyl-5-hydroxy-6-metoxy-1,4-benzoquinol methylase